MKPPCENGYKKMEEQFHGSSIRSGLLLYTDIVADNLITN